MATKRPPAASVQRYRYPSPNIPLSAIRRFALKIAKRFQPKKIILFGSYAYGTPHSESDVDLLVVMPTGDVVGQAVRICLALEWPFSLDLIVRTPNQIQRGLQEGDWFLREVVEKGKVLYEAPDESLGSQGGRRLARSKGSRLPRAAATGPRVFPLPTGGGEVPEGIIAGGRRRRSENP